MEEKTNLEGPNKTIGVRSEANNIEPLNNARSQSKEKGSPWKQRRHDLPWKFLALERKQMEKRFTEFG